MVTRAKVSMLEERIYEFTSNITSLPTLFLWARYSRATSKKTMIYATLCNILQHFRDIKLISSTAFLHTLLGALQKTPIEENASNYINLQYISFIKYILAKADKLAIQFAFGICKVLGVQMPTDTLIYHYIFSKMTAMNNHRDICINTIANDYIWEYIDIAYSFLKFVENTTNQEQINASIKILKQFKQPANYYYEGINKEELKIEDGIHFI